MRRVVLPVLAGAMLLLAGVLLVAAWSPAADAGGAPTEEAGAGEEPGFECRVVDGGRVCDTFGESDEGPGTR